MRPKETRQEILRLNVGSGGAPKEGFVNIDRQNADVNIDVRKGLPFDTNSVDFIYSSHFIEHLNYDEAWSFLNESFRVLKRGGKIRLSTPDLRIFAAKYLARDSLFWDDRRWPGKTLADQFNYVARQMGHAYIYDFESLQSLLKSVGFTGIQQVPFQDALDNRPDVSVFVGAEKFADDQNPNTPDYMDVMWAGKKFGVISEQPGRIELYKQVASSCKGPNVLDLGCGDGALLSYLPDSLQKYGVDFSRVAIERARERNIGHFDVGDIRKLNYGPDTFDTVIMMEVLEHIDDPDGAISEAVRVMKNGARLVITVPDEECITDEKWPGGVSLHVSTWSEESLRSLASKCGLSVTEVCKFGPNLIFALSCRKNPVPKTENTDRAPKVSFVMIVLNGMPFIEYSLKSVYEFAHEVIIVEGAVEKCTFAANPDGSSTDGTVQFIRSFPDPQKKIKLIQGRWPEKCEMQNEALKHVTGDYVWLIDSDEVYKREDLDKIKKILTDDPSITQVNFIPDNFWKGLDHIFVSPRFFEPRCHYRRLFKYVPGAVFTSHRPPTMVWPGSQCSTEQMHLLDGRATREMGIIPYHYSYVLDEQVRQKIELYRRYGWGKDWKIDLLEWYNECFLKWTPENRHAIEQRYPVWTGDRNSRTQLFTGSHPQVMEGFRQKLSRNECWLQQQTLQVIGDPYYQRKVVEAWSFAEIDRPIQERRKLMLENIEHKRSFWNVHVALAFLADKLRPENYLEVGVRTGCSLLPVLHSSTVKEIVAVDVWEGNYAGMPNTKEYAVEQIDKYKARTNKRFGIEFIKGDSHKQLKDLIHSRRKFDLITVDGDHTESGAWEDLEDAAKLLADRGAIVFDDIIHPSHSYLRKLVDKFQNVHSDYTALINARQDNGCAILLKGVDVDELLTERRAGSSEGQCKRVRVAGDYVRAGTQVAGESSFGAEIRKLFDKIRPRKVIETGTYLGTGTTTIIARALETLGIRDAAFYTIEVNPQNYARAKEYLAANNMNVQALNGLSVPRSRLPDRDEITRRTITEVDYDGIFVDHGEQNRVELYYRETDFPNVEDDLLYKCLERFDFRPDFVLLDSAGHMGSIEFDYLIEKLQGECYIALDDIYHVKHHRSFHTIQSDPRFELVAESKEKFGFCIARFAPGSVAQPKEGARPAAGNASVKKVLIVRSDSIGDFVIFSGALPYYRKLFSDSHISIVVRECSKEIAEACPYIDEVIVNHRESMVYDQNYAAEFIRCIQAAKFDVAICPIYSRDEVSDFITANSGANERIVSTGNDSNMPFEQIRKNNPYFTRLIPTRANSMQETERNLEFLKGLGVTVEKPYKTTVWMKQEHKDFADRLLRELNIERPIVICPFAQHPMRDWPIHKWTQLISRLRDYPILICGSQQNNEASENIIKSAEHPRIYNLCGKTTLRQLAALLDRANLCIGVESAPAHIASAVDCPHVVLMGGGHFGRFMPYSSKTAIVYNRMDCYGCNWRCKYGSDTRCINTITVEMVEQAANSWLQKAAELYSQHQKTIYERPEGEQYLVSAIISTYNSEKFIRGCLEDLENQTIADKLEIIVVNSGSQQNEEAVVREFQGRYGNIKYIKTDQRETIYQAWNRAVRASCGRYITTANADDRHKTDALEKMAAALDAHPDKVLVYADQVDVKEIQGRRVEVGKRVNGPFSRERLFKGECPPGSQPMWRAAVHKSVGYFDEAFAISGDYEFWFRLTQKHDFLYLSEHLGERLIDSEAVSCANGDLLGWENMVIDKCYRYALRERIEIAGTGLSEHPDFRDWPEVNVWRARVKAKLSGAQVSLADNVKSVWDCRTNPAPKLTIVLVTYRRRHQLFQALDSLNGQSEKDFEVIVVANDGDLSTLREKAESFEFGLCGVELEHNYGPSPARNKGSELAKAPYIAFMDDDAVADRNMVRNIVTHFQETSVRGLRGRVLPKTKGDCEQPPSNYDLGDNVIATACEVSSLSAYRKDAFAEVGGFDERLFGPEGIELSYRICKRFAEKTRSIRYFPDVIVYHDSRAAGPAQTEKALRMERMHLLAWRKDPNISGYRELVRSLYPGGRDPTTENNYNWTVNVAVCLEKDFPEHAAEWVRKANALQPQGVKGRCALGGLHVSHGEYDQARVMLESTLQPLQEALADGGRPLLGTEFQSYSEITECYLKACARLAECYIHGNDHDKVKRIYGCLLNDPHLAIPPDWIAYIQTQMASLEEAPRSRSTPENKADASAPVGPKNGYLVSAIVSTYNAEEFLGGCLEDLENQTIADRLEIIVVNSGSQQDEEQIVRQYQQKYDNIVYLKTEQREGIYSAWNRAAKVARGQFLTNANTDDRHRSDALEIMAKTLQANPDIALVYGDQIRTDTPNDTFAAHHGTEMLRRPDYSRERLLLGCCVGSQPMWRKSLHDEFGYFDESLDCAGDWDFWIRISNKYKFRRIPEFLGLYYYNQAGVEHGRKIHSLYERYIVGRRYGTEYIAVIPYCKPEPDDPLVSVVMPVHNGAKYIAEAIESVLIQSYPKFELIIVDDGSTDATRQLVQRYDDERIRYFYQANSGVSSARNAGIRRAAGQYIMPLDADDMMAPAFITTHLREFEKHSDADLVYCDVLLIDEDGHPLNVMKKPEYRDRRRLIRDLFRAGHPIVPFRLGIRRSVFEQIGFYDESLLVGEDYDMMRRFVKAGLKPHHLGEALHLRRMQPNSLTRNYSAQKAECHFEVVKRFAATFAYDELFPDVPWHEIPAGMRPLHAHCLAVVTYLAIGQEFVKSNSPNAYVKAAFEAACSQLNECLKIDPDNPKIRGLLHKCERGRQQYEQRIRPVVCHAR